MWIPRLKRVGETHREPAPRTHPRSFHLPLTILKHPPPIPAASSRREGPMSTTPFPAPVPSHLRFLDPANIRVGDKPGTIADNTTTTASILVDHATDHPVHRSALSCVRGTGDLFRSDKNPFERCEGPR